MFIALHHLFDFLFSIAFSYIVDSLFLISSLWLERENQGVNYISQISCLAAAGVLWIRMDTGHMIYYIFVCF